MYKINCTMVSGINKILNEYLDFLINFDKADATNIPDSSLLAIEGWQNTR